MFCLGNLHHLSSLTYFPYYFSRALLAECSLLRSLHYKFHNYFRVYHKMMSYPPEDDEAPAKDRVQRLGSLVPDMVSRPSTAWQQLVGVRGTKASLKRLALRIKKNVTPSAAIEPTSELITCMCYC